MTLPLSHTTMLDLTRVRPGPTCLRQLADCIEIEAPERGQHSDVVLADFGSMPTAMQALRDGTSL